MKYFALLFSFILLVSSLPVQAHAQHAAGPEVYNTVNVVFGERDEARKSLEWIVSNDRSDLAAHLITAMRYTQVPIREINEALTKLTSETHRTWFDWMLWQQRNPQIKPHESILDMKSAVFYALDPSFSRFFRPGMEFDIRPEEIVWGGVRVDGIPALDNPDFVSVKKAKYLRDRDEVFGVEINGDARAYPLRIMGWHEMFNDVIGGVPVSLAYCTLCGAGILFEGDYKGREKFDVKEPFTFGSSGFLYQSNKLMYDRQTDSLWNQFTGQPVSGPLKGSGITLNIRPVVITSWKKWKSKHPDTKVLDLDTGFRRDYGSGVVYKEYFASSDLMFPALGDQSRTLKQKDQVFGMRLEGGAKAWSLSSFVGGKAVNDTVGHVDVVLIGDAATRTVRAYKRPKGTTFAADKNAKVTDQNGMRWTLTEDHLIALSGERLERLPGHVSYWFAWAGYLGDESELFKE